MSTASDLAMKERNDLHAELFFAFVDDFQKTTRYVSLSMHNMKTYSIEFLRLLLDICSEIDDVAKLYWERSKPGTLPDRPTIDHWREIILADNPTMYKGLYSVGERIRCRPWEHWGESPRRNPDWWKVYNDVKHNRSEHFREANQWSVLSALCGLAGLSIIAFQSPHVWDQRYIRLVNFN
jgi:hypothetical protein